MRPGADLPRDLPDRIFRQSLRRPANLSDFLHLVVPQMADGFDCDRARLLDREFLTEDWRRREADLPFEVPYRTAEGEEPALVCVLIEHQSDTDALIPLRLLSYVVWYWDRQLQAWAGSDRPRPPLRLHPVLPIVLYSGTRPWGSNRTLADLLGGPEAFHAFAPRWEPVFWNLADQAPAGLLNGGEWSQMLAAVQAADSNEAAFESTFPDAMRRLSGLAERDPVRWQELVWMALSYAWSRRPANERERLLEITRQANPARQREVENMVKTVMEDLIDQGVAKGELRAHRKILRQLLTRQFGTLPEGVQQQIDQTTDLERLASAIVQVSQLKSLDELKL
jgi:hypothetical protein